MEEVGKDQADGTNVDVAHLVAAHQTVHGAHVGAGAAAHAAEHLREQGILGHFGAAVIKKDNVQNLFVVGVGRTGASAAHPGNIRGQALGSGVAGQHLKGHQGIVQLGNQLVQTGNGYVHARQGGDHAGVAFVGNGRNRAVFGHGKVTAAHAHVGGDELAAQLHAGHLDQALHVRILLDAGGLGEVVGHLIARKVDGGHNHVRRTFVAQLDDPFAKVGFVHDQAIAFQGGVQADFFGGHGLGLDHLFNFVFFGNAHDQIVGFFSGDSTVHVHATLFGLGLKLRVQLVHVLTGVVLGIGDLLDQCLFVHFLEHGFAVGTVGHGKGIKGTTQKFVVQGLVQFLMIAR